MTGETTSGKRLIAGLAGFVLVASGCEDSPFSKASGVEYPEYNLAVDCSADAAAVARRDILVDGVQLLRLAVAGPGYDQRLRVQIFPGESDINISGPEGESPKYVIAADALKAGKPVAADLAHGSLTALRYTAPQDTASAAPISPTTARAPSPDSPPDSPGEWLAFALSCEQGGINDLRQPEQ
jgi:hypothetical protein